MNRSMLLLLGVSAVALFGLTPLISVALSRQLAPIQDILRTLDALADGDLTASVTARARGELGQIAKGLNRMADRLRATLQRVTASGATLTATSDHLSRVAEELSNGARTQAASLEATSASLEQITGTVKQNADHARQANQLATGSRTTAEAGGQVVSGAVAAMQRINASSKKIAEIITTIDEIAFQTNLLALNAAVEAARAGEQGRGFAVVAAEVRTLAQRSAQAAKAIKSLIEDSVEKVDDGSELVNRSGQTLQEIVVSVKQVTTIIAEIAAASQEQALGVDQVNKSMIHMDAIVQTNSAHTEDLASTAEALAGQAGELLELMGRFRLDATARLERRGDIEPVFSHPTTAAAAALEDPRPTPAVV
jgi:methyl-accepting chemotaxis protein